MGAVALAVIVGVVGALASAGGGTAAVPGCGSFDAQSDAQDVFIERGGSPKRNLGGMDPDRDGVACENLPGPYKGYATVGYNRKKQFFFGTATMPSGASGEPACMYGNRRYPDAARRVNLFRITPDGDKPLLGEYQGRTEARPAKGRLLWKAKRVRPARGLYYAEVEERIPLSAYGRVECPGFSSRPALLPRPVK